MVWFDRKLHPEWDNKSLQEEDRGGQVTITVPVLALLFWVLVGGIWWGLSLYQSQPLQIEASAEKK